MEKPDDKIKAYYQSKRLSTEQIEQILNSPFKNKSSDKSIPTFLKYAAAFILLIGISYTFLYLPTQKQNVILENFANEIVFNHKKNLPPEFPAASLKELKKKK